MFYGVFKTLSNIWDEVFCDFRKLSYLHVWQGSEYDLRSIRTIPKALEVEAKDTNSNNNNNNSSVSYFLKSCRIANLKNMQL